jgi:hypothetical protein
VRSAKQSTSANAVNAHERFASYSNKKGTTPLAQSYLTAIDRAYFNPSVLISNVFERFIYECSLLVVESYNLHGADFFVSICKLSGGVHY